MICGEFKQSVMRLHNEVNQFIFGQGLVWQKVELLEDKLIIIAHNKRVHALSSIDNKDIFTTKLIDIALLVKFKENFKQSIIKELKLPVSAVLKDYDHQSETSICVILFDTPIQKIIEEL